MTKEEILHKHLELKSVDENAEYMDDYHVHELNAMDEYAKQEAIKFAKFVMDKAWQDLSNTDQNRWVVELTYGEMKDYTDDELYSLYLELKDK